jgi:hypothetical protein
VFLDIFVTVLQIKLPNKTISFYRQHVVKMLKETAPLFPVPATACGATL